MKEYKLGNEIVIVFANLAEFLGNCLFHSFFQSHTVKYSACLTQ